MPKLLFLNPLPFHPQVGRGAEHSTHELLSRLRRIGWQIQLICELGNPPLSSPENLTRGWKPEHLLRDKTLAIQDDTLGYPCWRLLAKPRAFSKWVDRFLDRFRPDLVVSHLNGGLKLARFAARRGTPSFFFIRDIKILNAEHIFRGVHPIAASPFAASYCRRWTRRPADVVLPFINLERCRAPRRRPTYITLINPIREKGVQTALKIARRLPNERFLFVKGEWLRQNAFLKEGEHPPNVTVWGYQTDMRRVYAVTDLLLVPSRVKEVFPRVILEAQRNGIPVLGSNRGGIPDTVGAGGILVPPGPQEVSAYVRILRQLRRDPARYETLRRKAEQNGRRAEFDPKFQVDRFVQIVSSKLRKRRAF